MLEPPNVELDSREDEEGIRERARTQARRGEAPFTRINFKTRQEEDRRIEDRHSYSRIPFLL